MDTIERAEQIQKELWEYAKETRKANPTIQYQDIFTIFVCMKLAELEEKINLKKQDNGNTE